MRFMRQIKKRRIWRGSEQLEPRMMLAGDLVAHWLAHDLTATHDDGQTITEWKDRVAGIATQTFGTPSLATDGIGGRGVVQFDAGATGDFLVVAAAQSPMSGAEAFSISFVFSTSQTELTGGSDVWHEGTGIVHANQLGFNKDWGISINRTAQVGAGIGKGLFEPTTSVFSTQRDLNDGAAHFVTFTRQAGTLSLYVDDAPPVRVQGADDQPRRELELNFGASSSSSEAFIGNLAEVRLFNGALSDAEVEEVRNEITTFYNNGAPTAVDDSYAAVEDQILFVSSGSGILANDIDPDGDSLTATLVDEPIHGQLGINKDGSFIYDPARNFCGTDTFTYTANDFRPSRVATVTMNVGCQHDPPIGVADSYKTTPTSRLTIPSFVGVLANDINIDDSPLSVELDSNVAAGSLELRSDGSFTYDPQGFSGTASFTYRINDAIDLSAPVAVSIVVNTAPTAAADLYSIQEDTTFVAAVDEGVLANDSDADGNELELSLIDGPLHGELDLNQDGSFTYVPELNFFGDDRFTYQISDGVDNSRIATVQLKVDAVNDEPTVLGEGYFVFRNEMLEIPTDRGLLVNDFDVETTDLTVTLISPPNRGQLTLDADGAFQYIPNGDFQDTDSFVYRVSDNDGAFSDITGRFFIDTAPVRISEIMAANRETIITRTRPTPEGRLTEDLLTPDWIELVNPSDVELELSGFHLTDNAALPTKWQIPNGVRVLPGGQLVVYASRLDITNPELDETGRLHTNFKISSDAAGGFVGIATPAGEFTHQLEDLPPQFPDVSFGEVDVTVGYLEKPSPGEPNDRTLNGVVERVQFSRQRGFYADAMSVELTVETPDAQIFYTLDGSVPDSETGIAYETPIPVDGTTTVRAAAIRARHVPSQPVTHTYLFMEDILNQPVEPEGFPDRWGPAGRADYEMDPDVVSDTQSQYYDPRVAEALTALPTISVVVNVDEFFGPDGIQSRPQNHGDQWERATSIEFIDFEKFDDFQINAGIRMVGNASRNPNRSKHNMRLAFRDDYGPSSLEAPLFGIGTGESHENLILSGNNGDSFVNPAVARRGQYVRDAWQRDLQTAMGYDTVRQTRAHLYINGLYWGMYHVFERFDASFFALHFGGAKEDYAAIKDVNGNTDRVEAISGDTSQWEELLSVVDSNISVAEKYEYVQQNVDVVNMIDYLLLNFYAGNNDWDHNNFRVGRRIDETGRFQFFTWDAERQDINALSVPNNQIGPVNRDITSFNKPGRPSRIHQRLASHEEYQLFVADRMHRHFFNAGVLTPEGASAIWNAQAEQVRLPLSAESARWGDLHSANSPRTVEGWQEILDVMNDDFFPVRTEIVFDQLQRRGFYPETAAPTFSQHGGEIVADFTLSMQAEQGAIYFTRDGTDPRQVGGEVAPTALQYDQAVSLSADVVVRARARNNGQWSALTEAAFVTIAQPAGSDSLRISELHYNPGAPSQQELAAGYADNDEFEFIELINISDVAIDLSGVRFARVDDQGVDFDFATSQISRLAPGARVLVVENSDAFSARYGTDLPVAGQWSGRLGNGGELITLAAGDDTIQSFSYDDAWHPVTDGGGPSLEIIEVRHSNLDAWSNAESWRASFVDGGTPGDASFIPGDSNLDGIFNSSDLVFVFQKGEYEDSIEDNSTFEEGDWDGDLDFNSSDFVFVFQRGFYVAEALAAVTANSKLSRDNLGALDLSRRGRFENGKHSPKGLPCFQCGTSLREVIHLAERGATLGPRFRRMFIENTLHVQEPEVVMPTHMEMERPAQLDAKWVDTLFEESFHELSKHTGGDATAATLGHRSQAIRRET